MLTRAEAERLLEKVLGFSKFPECSVSLESSERAFIRFARNGITTSGFQLEQSVSIASTREGRTGSTQSSQFDDRALEEAVRLSERLAGIAPPNREAVDPLPRQQYPTWDHFDEATARARGPEMIPHVRAVIEAARGAKLVASGFCERSASAFAIANKAGNLGYARTTDSSLAATMRTPDGSSSGWASLPGVRLAALDGKQVASRAASKCLAWQRQPRRLEPGPYTVVLEPTAAGDLLQLLAFNWNARAAEEGRSFLSRKGGGTLLGDKLFPESVTLRSAPGDSRFPSLPWASDGLPNRPVTWVEKGVVKHLRYDRYWAARSEKEPLPAPGYLILEPGTESTDDLIRATERGLLVTRFWYIRNVNPQTVQYTGLTRDGLFLIENGKIAGPVINFRFNESPVRMLQNIVRIGSAVRVRGSEGAGMVAPSLLVKNFQFSSVSDAV
jgi:predicted Zn-dependent protease